MRDDTLRRLQSRAGDSPDALAAYHVERVRCGLCDCCGKCEAVAEFKRMFEKRAYESNVTINWSFLESIQIRSWNDPLFDVGPTGAEVEVLAIFRSQLAPTTTYGGFTYARPTKAVLLAPFDTRELAAFNVNFGGGGTLQIFRSCRGPLTCGTSCASSIPGPVFRPVENEHPTKTERRLANDKS